MDIRQQLADQDIHFRDRNERDDMRVIALLVASASKDDKPAYFSRLLKCDTAPNSFYNHYEWRETRFLAYYFDHFEYKSDEQCIKDAIRRAEYSIENTKLKHVVLLTENDVMYFGK